MAQQGALAWLILALSIASAVALLLAIRSISRRWGVRWAALRAKPRWLQVGALVALAWLGLRLARAGWRPLVALLALLAILGLWGELAARATANATRARE
jgi:hypothetical protein